MILGLTELRALAELKRRRNAFDEARAAYLHAEANCWSLGISHRQISAVSGVPPHTVYRRQKGDRVRDDAAETVS